MIKKLLILAILPILILAGCTSRNETGNYIPGEVTYYPPTEIEQKAFEYRSIKDQERAEKYRAQIEQYTKQAAEDFYDIFGEYPESYMTLQFGESYSIGLGYQGFSFE